MTDITQLQNEVDKLSATDAPSAGAASVPAAAVESPQETSSVQGAPATAGAATISAANAYADQAAAQTLGSAESYTDAQTQEALSSAKTYTDAQSAQTLSSAKAYTDAAVADIASDLTTFEQQTNARFNEQDRRIDRLGAMSEASSHMAMGAAGAGENGRLAAGVGFYNSEAAVSVGYARSLGAHATFNIGASASSSEVSGGVGFGVDIP
jgi:hypothetical protein